MTLEAPSPLKIFMKLSWPQPRATAKNPQTSSSLVSNSDYIYELLLIPNCAACNDPFYALSTQAHTHPMHTSFNFSISILQLNFQINHGARPILYSANPFSCVIDSYDLRRRAATPSNPTAPAARTCSVRQACLRARGNDWGTHLRMEIPVSFVRILAPRRDQLYPRRSARDLSGFPTDIAVEESGDVL